MAGGVPASQTYSALHGTTQSDTGGEQGPLAEYNGRGRLFSGALSSGAAGGRGPSIPHRFFDQGVGERSNPAGRNLRGRTTPSAGPFDYEHPGVSVGVTASGYKGKRIREVMAKRLFFEKNFTRRDAL